ncbi:MAG: FecR domain-containing protein, partial [Myxococcota bacterium]|nr:FecR domain-containing protein [Myxococcota bacterium]
IAPHVVVEPSVVDAVTPEKGSRLVALDNERSWSAFERHALKVSPQGEVLVNRWEAGAMELVLVGGSVTAEVDKLKAGESFQIRTRDVVVRVVGTRFTVKLIPAGGTEVSVEEGIVEVTERNGVVARLEVGDKRHFGADPGPEVQSPEEPRPEVAPRVERRRRAAPADATGDELKVIEIDVPPQSAPVPEKMPGEGDAP